MPRPRRKKVGKKSSEEYVLQPGEDPFSSDPFGGSQWMESPVYSAPQERSRSPSPEPQDEVLPQNTLEQIQPHSNSPELEGEALEQKPSSQSLDTASLSISRKSKKKKKKSAQKQDTARYALTQSQVEVLEQNTSKQAQDSPRYPSSEPQDEALKHNTSELIPDQLHSPSQSQRKIVEPTPSAQTQHQSHSLSTQPQGKALKKKPPAQIQDNFGSIHSQPKNAQAQDVVPRSRPSQPKITILKREASVQAHDESRSRPTQAQEASHSRHTQSKITHILQKETSPSTTEPPRSRSPLTKSEVSPSSHSTKSRRSIYRPTQNRNFDPLSPVKEQGSISPPSPRDIEIDPSSHIQDLFGGISSGGFESESHQQTSTGDKTEWGLLGAPDEFTESFHSLHKVKLRQEADEIISMLNQGMHNCYSDTPFDYGDFHTRLLQIVADFAAHINEYIYLVKSPPIEMLPQLNQCREQLGIIFSQGTLLNDTNVHVDVKRDYSFFLRKILSLTKKATKLIMNAIEGTPSSSSPSSTTQSARSGSQKTRKKVKGNPRRVRKCVGQMRNHIEWFIKFLQSGLIKWWHDDEEAIQNSLPDIYQNFLDHSMLKKDHEALDYFTNYMDTSLHLLQLYLQRDREGWPIEVKEDVARKLLCVFEFMDKLIYDNVKSIWAKILYGDQKWCEGCFSSKHHLFPVPKPCTALQNEPAQPWKEAQPWTRIIRTDRWPFHNTSLPELPSEAPPLPSYETLQTSIYQSDPILILPLADPSAIPFPVYHQGQPVPFDQDQHDPFHQGQNDPFDQCQHDPVTQGQHDPFNQGQHDPVSQNQHDPFDQGQISEEHLQEQHDQSQHIQAQQEQSIPFYQTQLPTAHQEQSVPFVENQLPPPIPLYMMQPLPVGYLVDPRIYAQQQGQPVPSEQIHQEPGVQQDQTIPHHQTQHPLAEHPPESNRITDGKAIMSEFLHTECRPVIATHQKLCTLDDNKMEEIINAYMEFMLIKAVHGDTGLEGGGMTFSPDPDVEKFWQSHVLCTNNYLRFMQVVRRVNPQVHFIHYYLPLTLDTEENTRERRHATHLAHQHIFGATVRRSPPLVQPPEVMPLQNPVRIPPWANPPTQIPTDVQSEVLYEDDVMEIHRGDWIILPISFFRDPAGQSIHGDTVRVMADKLEDQVLWYWVEIHQGQFHTEPEWAFMADIRQVWLECGNPSRE